MSIHVSAWRWIEHLFAVAGLAWLAHFLIESAAGFIDRQRELTQTEKELRSVLKQIWEDQHAYPEGKTAAQFAGSNPSTAALSQAEAEKVRRQLDILRWAGFLAWRRSRESGHREVLAEIYARTWKTFARQGKAVTPEEVRRFSENIARKQPRPSDPAQGLWYDLTELYLQACRLQASALKAAVLVPMMLEEAEQDAESTPQQLLVRCELRMTRELDSYRPKEG